MKPRKNEFTGVKNRNLLDELPPNTNYEEWFNYRDKYNRASNLEDNQHPIQLDVELNGGCNMKCPFCLHGYDKIENTLFDFDEYKKLIDEAINLGVRSLKLNYINEPLLRLDLEQFIIYAKNKGMLNIFMSTNGSMLTPKRAISILESGITKMFISIDAITKETYNEQRLSGKYEKVVANILNFIELRNSRGLSFPLIRVNFLKNKINEAEEVAFVEFWQDKADMIAIQNMNDLPDQDSGLILKEESKDYKCSFPFKQLVVNHKGNILPCCTMYGDKLRLGNVKDMTLKEAWDSPKAKELRKLHKDGNYRENPICNRCING